MGVRISTAVVLGLVLLFAVLASPPRAASLAADAPARFPRVTLISDSVAAAISFDTGAVAILSEGVDLFLEPGQARRLGGENPSEGVAPPTALELIATLGQRLGPTVIISVGNNDFSDRYAQNMEDALAALHRAGVQHVLWATLHYSAAHHGVLTMNNAIEEAATRHPEMIVVDWNGYVNSHPGLLLPDEMHLVGGGSRAMARLFHAGLENLGIPVATP
jgi:hypothetical protein